MLETTATTPARPLARHDGEAGDELDFDWRPEPLMRAVDSDRAFRWPIVIASLFIGVAVALVIRLFIASPADSANARLEEYRTVATALQAALGGALDASTGDPATVAALADAVDAARESVSRPLPRGVPIIGQGPGAELDAAHQRLTTIVDSAATIVPRLHLSRTYRQAGADILGLPLLPNQVSPDLIDPAARTLDEFRAGAVAAAARLDDEPDFAAFRDLVTEFVEGLGPWSDRYLLSLRRGDSEAAAALVADLHARADLARTELNQRLDDLDTAITTDGLEILDALVQAGLVADE
jgi:hypothetical protein